MEDKFGVCIVEWSLFIVLWEVNFWIESVLLFMMLCIVEENILMVFLFFYFSYRLRCCFFVWEGFFSVNGRREVIILFFFSFIERIELFYLVCLNIRVWFCYFFFYFLDVLVFVSFVKVGSLRVCLIFFFCEVWICIVGVLVYSKLFFNRIWLVFK